MTSVTISVLTDHQMARLYDFFHFSILEKVGVIHETGALVVEYRGFKGEDKNTMKTMHIPRSQEGSI